MNELLHICRRASERRDAQIAPAVVLTPGWREPASDAAAVAIAGCNTPDGDRLAQAVSVLLQCAHADSANEEKRHANGLEIDWSGRRAVVAGRELPLTATELRLLNALARRRGQVLSRQELAQAARHRGRAIQHRTIDVHIKSIRQKLADYAGLLETVRGFGYRLRA